MCSSQAMRTPPTAGSAIATQARRRRGGAAGGRGNAISVSVAGALIRGVGRSRIRPAGPDSSDAAAPPGPATVTALAPRRRIAPVGQFRGSPSRTRVVESAAVGGAEIGHGDRPTADLDGDVPPGHVGVVEPHGHVAATPEDVPALPEGYRPSRVRTTDDT